MNDKLFKIGQKLISTGSLSTTEYEYLIDNRNEEFAEFLKNEAVKKRKAVYGNSVFIRGLIEISNICKNDCYYCGIRKSNKACKRYRLSTEEILKCADMGYKMGFRTFVLQGGEDGFFTDEILVPLIREIKLKYPDCAVTLSLGEDYRFLLISGPNTGGKTVLLKTVGLLSLMTKCGLLVPADEDSNIMIYDKVCCDIGDDQSIQANLSTFSSHMKNITDIINMVTPNSLVLFDEIEKAYQISFAKGEKIDAVLVQ